MKNITLLFLLFCLSCTYTNAQNIPNSSFEEHLQLTNDTFPKYWIPANNDIFAESQGGSLGTLTNDSHSGNWAIKMQATQENGIYPGGYVSGDASYNSNDPLVTRAFPFNKRPKKLTFYYKFIGNVTDTAIVDLYLMKRDSSFTPYHFGDTVGIASGIINLQDQYTKYELPIKYFNSDRPDYLRIIFCTDYEYETFSQGPQSLSTILYIDDIDFEGRVSAQENIKDNKKVILSPNPASKIVKISPTDNINIEYIKVFDLSGKSLVEGRINNSNLDVSMLKSGLYILEIQTNQGIVNKKMVIKR